MRRALVTGATGLVGSHIVERLAQEGWSVRALVRDQRAAAWLRELGAEELVRGDVLDASSLAEGARGCDAIFHSAAAITPSSGGWEAYRSLNVDGTAAIVGAARDSGARLLHLSSVAVYGPHGRFRPDGGKTTEATPLAPIPERAYYARSKRESEQLVLAAHAAGEIWATAIRPDVIYGRRDRQFVPRFGRLLATLHAMPLPGGGRNTLAIVHASNVADGAYRALTSQLSGGKAYNIANEGDVTFAEFVKLAARGIGVRVLAPPVPMALLRGALLAAQRVTRALHLPGAGVLQHASLGFVGRDNPFSSDLAARELGWKPVIDPHEAIVDAFRWWRLHRRGR